MPSGSDLAKIQGLNALKNAFETLPSELDTNKRMVVGTPVEYGQYLEDGTSRMPAYPWLQPSVDATVRKGPSLVARSSTTEELVTNTALDIETNARRRLASTSVRPYPQTSNLLRSVEAMEL